MPTTPTMFKTPEGQAGYFAAYDAVLALWPVTVTPLEVPTRQGITHINACGPEDAPAILLLPGAAISSTMWYPNVAALSQKYRVYAVDIIGEMGKSVCTLPLKRPEEFVEWLCSLMDGLSLPRAYIAGISLGGHLALTLASSAPERVAGLILISPATLLSMRLLFFLRAAAAIFTPSLSAERRQYLITGTASPSMAPLIKQMMTSGDFRYRMNVPKVITPDQLRKISAPTLLLLGEKEVIYNPQAALKRARRFIPQVEGEIIPGAGHAASVDQPEAVNRRILDFLARVPLLVDRAVS